MRRFMRSNWIWAGFLIALPSFTASPSHGQEPTKHRVTVTYKPVRDPAIGDKIILSWRTDFPSTSASVTVTGDSGAVHQQVSHPRKGEKPLEPKQITKGTEVVASEFTDQFTYGQGKELFSQMGTVHIDISVADNLQIPVAVASVDIDLSGIEDYFSCRDQAADLERIVVDLRNKAGQGGTPPDIGSEQVTALDESISLVVSSDQDIRVHASAYSGDLKNLPTAEGTDAKKSDSIVIGPKNSQTLVIRNLAKATPYIVTIRDEKGRMVGKPIVTDHTGSPLKTLDSINHAHVEIVEEIVKPKEVTFNLKIRDVAKLRISIQKITPTLPEEVKSIIEDVRLQSAKPGRDLEYSVTVPVSLDSDAEYIAVVTGMTGYDEPDKNDMSTSKKPFRGRSGTLFKTVAMKINSDGIEFSTSSQDNVTMKCSATLPGITKTVDSPKTGTTTPSCKFMNADLFPQVNTGGAKTGKTSKPASGGASGKAAVQSEPINFTFDVSADDKSGRTQTQTLTLSASFTTVDSKGKPIDYSKVASSVEGSTKKAGPFRTILKLFMAVAPILGAF